MRTCLPSIIIDFLLNADQLFQRFLQPKVFVASTETSRLFQRQQYLGFSTAWQEHWMSWRVFPKTDFWRLKEGSDLPHIQTHNLLAAQDFCMRLLDCIASTMGLLNANTVKLCFSSHSFYRAEKRANGQFIWINSHHYKQRSQNDSLEVQALLLPE